MKNKEVQEVEIPNEKHPLTSEVKNMEIENNEHILDEVAAEEILAVEPVEDVVVEEEIDVDETDRLFSDEIAYRTMDLSRASYIDEDTRRVRIGVSSESEVERSFGLEVLSHRAEDVDMSFIASGTAPLLDSHDMSRQIGIVEKFKLDETAKRTIAVVRFGRSALAQEVFQDVVDGIKRNISVGYKINKLERSNNDIIGDHYRASWTPMEASIVAIPADASRLVGVGRSQSKTNKKVEIKMEERKEINLDEVRSQSADDARKEMAKNSKEILDLAAKHNKRDLGNQAIGNGSSVEEFRGTLLNEIGNSQPLETPANIGLTEKETKRFSILKAVNAMANPTDRRAQEAAAFEFECSAAAANVQGRTAQGVMLPAEIMSQWGNRGMTMGNEGDLSGEDFRPQDFIDVLRANSSIMSAGATMLRGLTGDVKIPKKLTASAAAFVATEGGAVANQTPTIGNVSLTPKTLGAFVDTTRQLMIQSSLDVENLIRDDLTKAIALHIDNVGISGSGNNGNPKGILNTTGINSATAFAAASSPTYLEMLGMESLVAADNALLGDLSYIVNPTNMGNMKGTPKVAGTSSFVAEGGQINGYNAIVSTQIDANKYLFGNFSDFLVGFFGTLDIVVDPYSLSSTGSVRIVALQSVDMAVRHPVSFCKAG